MFPQRGMALLHSTRFWLQVLFSVFSSFASRTFSAQMGLIITATSSEPAADIIFNTKQTGTIEASVVITEILL